MPAKIYMNIQNMQKVNNVIKLNTERHVQQNVPTFQQPLVTGTNGNSFNASMISRIHTAKSGCGCGR